MNERIIHSEDEPEKAFLPEAIPTLHEWIKNNFTDFFEKEKGFQKIEAEPLIPRNDESLLFTNATIVPLKPFIQSGFVPGKGLSIEQPCLRVQNLKHLKESGFNPEYMSYFTMLGTLSPADQIQQHIEDVWEFLTRKIGVDKRDIKILASAEDPQLEIWRSLNDQPLIEINTRRESFYKWKYGMEEVSGIGVTFAIRQTKNDFGDIGNLVGISKSGRLIGYEFGFGIETILSRIQRRNGPFETGKIALAIPFENKADVKILQDCIASLVVLYRNGLRPGPGREKFIVKKYLKGLLAIQKRSGATDSDLMKNIEVFEEVEFGEKTKINEAIIDDLVRYRSEESKNIKLLEDFIINQERLFLRGLLKKTKAEIIEGIKKKAVTDYKIDAEDIADLLRAHFK